MLVLWDWLAYNIALLLPKRITYYAGIRLGSWGTTGKYTHSDVSDMTLVECLRRWGRDWLKG